MERRELTLTERQLVESVYHFTEATVKDICKGRLAHIIDDITQDAHLAVCHAAMLYDPTIDMQFETYAYPFIYAAIRTSAKQYGHSISLPPHCGAQIVFVSLMMRNDEDGNCKDDELLGSTSMEDEEQLAKQVHEDLVLEDLLHTLKNAERKVVRNYYGFDSKAMSFNKMSKEMNLRPKDLQIIFNKAMMQIASMASRYNHQIINL